ncbi:MAG TPA: hypothetical protein VFQ61_36350 [Polyangiaceae bacterium]|nr:hypothetical protein [Polyangiaceae bacterium]
MSKRMERLQSLASLGPQRLRVIDCLGGNSPWAPGYWEPPAQGDVFAVYRGYVERMTASFGADLNPVTIRLLAAARLLMGEVAAARVLIEHLPERRIQLDHGAGRCLILPLYVLQTAIPWPSEVGEARSWLAGSAEQRALSSWLDDNAARLVWIEAEGRFLR